MYLVVLSVIAAIIGFITVAYFAQFVFKQSPGTEKMVEISKAIQEGAMAFLTREYKAVAVVLVFVALVMFFWLKQPLTTIAYIVGAIFSGTAGFVGLYVTTRANSRTTSAAMTGGLPPALLIAFRGGAVSGMTVASRYQRIGSVQVYSEKSGNGNTSHHYADREG